MAFRAEVFEASMVSKYFYCVGGACELRAPFLEGADYRQQFLVVDLIVALRRSHLFGEVRYRAYSVVALNLGEHCSVDVVRGVGFQDAFKV